MLVVHGFWAARDGLCLWAEDSGRPVSSDSQALRSARPHPFAAPAGTLAAIHPGTPAEAVLLLPSLRTAPLDSPELVRVTPRPHARGKPALLPWTVPVIVLYAPSALAALPQRAPGIRYGASMDFLAGVAAFATELVARGRVLPTLDHDGAGAVARWRPVIQGPDAGTLRALAAVMPPVCRAVPGADDPYDLVMAALTALTDAAARQALPAGTQLMPARRGRRPVRLPADEAWLTALVGPDGRFDADSAELSALAARLAPWEDVGTGQTGPARATFRLAEAPADPVGDLFAVAADAGSGEPAADANGDVQPEPAWRLEFLLQSVADPSLLIPAQQAWTDDGTLGRWLPRPQELLLAELGRASRRISPALTWPALFRSRNSRPRRSWSRSTATHWPRSRTSGALVCASAAISSSLRVSSPTASCQRNSISWSLPNMPAFSTTPSTRVCADMVSPSLLRRFHQDGNKTPNPASSRAGAAESRKW